MPRQLQIARVENELGTLTDQEAVEMLNGGFLSPTDLYRVEGTTDWKPLSELKCECEAAESQLDSIRQKMTVASSALTSKAAQLSIKFKAVAARSKVQMTDSASRMLDSYTPQIQKLVKSQFVSHKVTQVQEALRDEDFMRKVFGATYDCLPKPICRFVSEEAFIQFCLERRQRFFHQETGRPKDDSSPSSA